MVVQVRLLVSFYQMFVVFQLVVNVSRQVSGMLISQQQVRLIRKVVWVFLRLWIVFMVMFWVLLNSLNQVVIVSSEMVIVVIFWLVGVLWLRNRLMMVFGIYQKSLVKSSMYSVLKLMLICLVWCVLSRWLVLKCWLMWQVVVYDNFIGIMNVMYIVWMVIWCVVRV